MYKIAEGWSTMEKERKKNEDELIKYLNSYDARLKAIFIAPERVNATSREISEDLYNRLKKEVPHKFFVRVSSRKGGRQIA